MIQKNEREFNVICERFGLFGRAERTLEEIGNDLKVTRERVRQIEAKALRKLKTPEIRSLLYDLKDDQKDFWDYKNNYYYLNHSIHRTQCNQTLILCFLKLRDTDHAPNHCDTSQKKTYPVFSLNAKNNQSSKSDYQGNQQ